MPRSPTPPRCDRFTSPNHASRASSTLALVGRFAPLVRTVLRVRTMKLSAWSLSVALLAGCGGSNQPAEGPAEHAGKDLDHAAEGAKEKTNDAKDETKKKANDLKDEADELKDKVDDDTR